MNASQVLTIHWPVRGDQIYFGGGSLLIAAAIFYFNSDGCSNSLSNMDVFFTSLATVMGVTSFLPEDGIVLNAATRTMYVWERRWALFIRRERFDVSGVAFVVCQDPEKRAEASISLKEVSVLLDGNRIINLPNLPNEKSAFAVARKLANFWQVPVIDWFDARWASLNVGEAKPEWGWWRYALGSILLAYLTYDAVVSPPPPPVLAAPNLFTLILLLFGPTGLAVAFGIAAVGCAGVGWLRWKEEHEPQPPPVNSGVAATVLPEPLLIHGDVDAKPESVALAVGLVGVLVLVAVLMFHEHQMDIYREMKAQEAKADAELLDSRNKAEAALSELSDRFTQEVQVSLDSVSKGGWTVLEARWIGDAQAAELGVTPAESRLARERVRAYCEPLLAALPKDGSKRIVAANAAPPAPLSESTKTWRMLLLLQKIRAFTLQVEGQPPAPNAPVLICFGLKGGLRFASYDLWFPERAHRPAASSPPPPSQAPVP